MRSTARRTLLVTAFAAIACVLGPVAGAEADRYAAPNAVGETENCLNEEHPCSLEAALKPANAPKGETVWLAAGTYKPTGALTVPNEFVILAGASSTEPTLIEAKGEVGLTVAQAFSTVRDVRIKSTAATKVGLALSAEAKAERVQSTGATTTAACQLGSATVKSSLCQSSGGRGVYTNYSVGAGSPSLLIKLFNVTAVGATNGIEAVAGNQAAVSIYAKSTIAVGATTDVLSSSTNPGGAGVNINLSHSNFDTSSALGETFITAKTVEGNQSEAPLFVDAAAGDYREQPTSPTRRAGTTAELSGGELDLAGQPRTILCAGTTYIDIGAYQLQECPPLPPEEPEEPKTPEEPGHGGGTPGGGSESTGDSTPKAATPAPATAPQMTKLALAPRRFAVTGRKRGSSVTFTLSAPASVRLELLAQRPRKGKKPVLVKVGTLTVAGVTGTNKVNFTGRLKGKSLAPGRYTLRATATASGLSSAPATASFEVRIP